MSEQSSLAKDLNLDVQAEQARALHRVIRAMHDGHCPSCGYLGPSDSFQVSRKAFGACLYVDHVCPSCEFTVTDREAKAGLAEFSPFLQKSVKLFEQWRSPVHKMHEQAFGKEPEFNASGSKYLREIVGAIAGKIDVYGVLLTFSVTCPARQHAVKKLLCSGLRGKGSCLQDLQEARDAIDRAIQVEEGRVDSE